MLVGKRSFQFSVFSRQGQRRRFPFSAGKGGAGAPTDFSVVRNPTFTLTRILPSVSALERSTPAVHELIGALYYRLRGWS